MWHQTPRASVCYYKLLLLPHSLYTGADDCGNYEIPACYYNYYLHLFGPLRADEGKDDFLYAANHFKSSRGSI